MRTKISVALSIVSVVGIAVGAAWVLQFQNPFTALDSAEHFDETQSPNSTVLPTDSPTQSAELNDDETTSEAVSSSASFSVGDLLCSLEAGSQIGAEWTAVLALRMQLGSDNSTARVLESLEFELIEEDPTTSTLADQAGALEYGVFMDSGPDGVADGVFNPLFDGFFVEGVGFVVGQPFVRWNGDGSAAGYGSPQDVSSLGDLRYTINFVHDVADIDGDASTLHLESKSMETFPDGTSGSVDRFLMAGAGDGNGYVVAVRSTSGASVPSRTRVMVTNATMIEASLVDDSSGGAPFVVPGEESLDAAGVQMDTYAPVFAAGEILTSSCTSDSLLADEGAEDSGAGRGPWGIDALSFDVAMAESALEGGGAKQDEEEDDAASFTAADAIPAGLLDRSGHGLVPLNDWFPLFNILMVGDEYEAGGRFFYRGLQSLTFTIIGDPDWADRPYTTDGAAGPIVSDFLEFALFREDVGPNMTIYDGSINLNETEAGNIVARWDNTGAPFGQVDQTFGGLTYELDFSPLSPTGNPAVAPFPINTGFTEDGNSYVLMARTSATWRFTTTTAYIVNDALMVPEIFDDDGMPADSYTPDFPGGEILDDLGTAYSSSFTTYDITGGFVDDVDPDFANYFQHRLNLYTPHAELTRPRFDLGGGLFNFVAGQITTIRKLMPLDTWTPLLGINIHSTPTDIRGQRQFDFRAGGNIDDPRLVDFREVNVVLTDIGADPFGPEGNGGFDPNSGLEQIYDNRLGSPGRFAPGNLTIGHDHVFNGLAIFFDTNNNGLFDAPTYDSNAGIVTITDFPLSQDYPYGTVPEWEYIPFPPGGGDPWWKMKIRTFAGTTEGLGTGFGGFPGAFGRFSIGTDGFVEYVPEASEGGVLEGPVEGPGERPDFFIVARSDSGLQDISLLEGDGTAMLPGADYKAFIEPRRFDVLRGNTEGGIHIDSMIPINDFISPSTPKWQDDPLWGPVEPWWPERNHTASTTKSSRTGFEVHDLTILYESRSEFEQLVNIPFLGFDPSTWVDPFGLRRSFFLNGQDLLMLFLNITFIQVVDAANNVAFILESGQSPGFHPSFETAPFLNPRFDFPPEGPRSQFFPAQLPLPPPPDRFTWPAATAGVYPHYSDWNLEDRTARLLKQTIDSESELTAMLGFNFVGTNDVVVNRINTAALQELAVAFWGPDFDPSDLMPLDPSGADTASGVTFWADSIVGVDGVFRGQAFPGFLTDPTVRDTLVPVSNLEWANAAEPIDMDGDRVADDMNGDGVVDTRDHAWVLFITPVNALVLPLDDDDLTLDATGGDDAFLVVRTSDTISRGERFRAVVPAYLPSRLRDGGVSYAGLGNISDSALTKTSPEEQTEFDFISHDMMETNVPTKVVNLAPRNTQLVPSGPAFAVFGVDVSTNRPEGTIELGVSGTGGASTFIDTAKTWPVDFFVGKWLVDEKFGSFQITGNSDTRLNLIGGTPVSGSYRIVQEPTFLEQLVVEFHRTSVTSGFRLSVDFLPLSADQRVSGVALYRDNDAHPQNRNGVFDEGVDIPLTLDDPPAVLGLGGNPDAQVKFVFSSPGTDNWPSLLSSQPHLRQWVPDGFGRTEANPDFGPEFFVVVRASANLQEGHDFGAALVSWGPATPTAPDPDTFTFPPPPIQPVDEFNKFNEFPFGSRALGFITFYEEPQTRYFMRGSKTFTEPEPFVVPWIRSTAYKKVGSSTITARDVLVGPNTIIVDSVAPTVLPAVVPPSGFEIVIRGDNFGPNPIVSLSNYETTVIASTDSSINVRLDNKLGVVPSNQPPIVLIVQNPEKSEVRSVAGLFTVTGVSPQTIQILSISPGSANAGEFPVTIRGIGFSGPEFLEVFFGETLMPVREVRPEGDIVESGTSGIADDNSFRDFSKNWTPNEFVGLWLIDVSRGTFKITANTSNELTLAPAVRTPVPGPYLIGTSAELSIVVEYPNGGLTNTGPLDVTVMLFDRSDSVVAQDTLLQGFEFLNKALRPCFIATAAYGSAFESELDVLRGFRDGVLLKSPVGVAMVETYYSSSPAVAEYIAQRPALAGAVRVGLTPVVWTLKWPLGALAIVLTLSVMYRRRRYGN